MEDSDHKKFREGVELIYRRLVIGLSIIGIFICFLIYAVIDPSFSAFRNSKPQNEYVALDAAEGWDKVENGVHVRTGFIDGEGLMETVNNCVNCHSSKLVTQNRMSKEGWAATIDWMQETQNLWDLGDSEEVIINYLVTNYPVEKKGRRQAITNIEWYELED